MVMQGSARAVRRSVQDIPTASLNASGSDGWDIGEDVHLFSIAQFADEILPWGTAVRERDKQLREFLPTESLLLSTVGTVASRNAAMSWKLDGGRRQVDRAQRMLQEAQFGDGWRGFVIRLTFDLMSQSNGAFIETVRETDSPSSAVIGISTMDARRCIRTGDPRAPVIYEDAKGQRHLMAWWEAFPLAEMPSNIERLRGIQYCLAPDAMVRMAEGPARRIRELVRERSTAEVMALTPQGLRPRRITGWYENQRNGREFVNLRGRCSQHIKGPKLRNSWLTEDHLVLTPDGWRRTGDLVTGDPIITEHRAPNHPQRALLIGTLLGDGSMPASKSAKLTIGHLLKNRDWIEAKAHALRDFEPTVYEDTKRGMAHIRTRVQPAFAEFRAKFYQHGRKLLPLDLLEANLSPILLAAWYQDNGTITNRLPNRRNRRPAASIGTSGSDPSAVAWAAQVLSRAGYEARAVSAGVGGGKQNLRFTADGSQRLFEDIARFVVPSMRYKLPIGAPPYDPSAWELGDSEPFVDEAIISRTGAPYAPMVYCIDVEGEHNFITAGVVVHNCFLDRVLRAAQKFRDIAQFQREKMGGRRPRAMHLLSNVNANQVTDALSKLKAAQDNLGQYRYSDPVIITNLAGDKPVSAATIELASLPDGFDAAEEFRQYVAFLAVAALVDYQEIAPLPGGNLGTSSQSEVQHRKARGKGPALFQKLIEDRFNFYGVVSGCTFAFDEQDFAAQLEEANVRKARADRLALLVEKSILPSAVARQIMADEGDLDEEYMAMMAESDATPDVTVSDTETAEATADNVAAAEGAPIIGAPAAPPPTAPPPQAMQGLRAKREPTPRELGHAAVMDGVEDEMRGRMETALDGARKRFLAAVKREAPATSPAVEAVKAMADQITDAIERIPEPVAPPPMPPVVEAVEVLGDRIVQRLEAVASGLAEVKSQVREAAKPRRVTRTPVYSPDGQIIRVDETTAED